VEPLFEIAREAKGERANSSPGTSFQMNPRPVCGEHSLRLCRALNQRLQQFMWVCFNGLTNLDKFHDVDAPFTAFVFRDERLRPTKTFGEFMRG